MDHEVSFHLETLISHKKRFYENVTLSHLQNNKLRRRPPALIHKYSSIESYLIEYSHLSIEDKKLYLIPILKAINGIMPMVDPAPLNSYL